MNQYGVLDVLLSLFRLLWITCESVSTIFDTLVKILSNTTNPFHKERSPVQISHLQKHLCFRVTRLLERCRLFTFKRLALLTRFAI